jgi:hypothetical protein
MKRFMLLCAGLLCLALALVVGFEIGSQRAEAQSGPTIDELSSFRWWRISQVSSRT